MTEESSRKNAPSRPGGQVGQRQRDRRSRDTRLGSYLVTGSFQPAAVRPVSRPVRRNRIIFVTVMLLIALFTLVWIALGG